MLIIIFRLVKALKDVMDCNPRWEMECQELLNSMMVFIKDQGGNKLKLDIVTQMGGKKC